MFTERTSVGLDVHAFSVRAAGLDTTTGQLLEQTLTPSAEHVRDWVRGLPGPAAVAYEAGPTGFGLSRALTAAGIRCEVVAPSKLLRPAGDRVKTDARDAIHLARLLHLDEYTAVCVPTVGAEAARDLVRAREQCRGDLMRARHRLSKLLLRQGLVWDNTAWTAAHEAWLRSHHFGRRGVQLAFDEALDAVFTVHARRDRLDAAITEMAASDPALAGPVGRLRCLRGVSTLTATGLCVEVADWNRFTGSTIGAYLGLVPSEFSSGARRVQGGITKTGNSQARRLLVEAAWHHRRPLRSSRERARRADGQPAAVRDRAEAGNRRLHQRWTRLDQRNKRPTVAVVAVARELAGWCWSLATLEDIPRAPANPGAHPQTPAGAG
jgi:transposase